jgi:hypothetical protein
MFEENWQLSISVGVLKIKDPKEIVHEVRLDLIKGISIQTTDSGPWDSDVIWLISTEDAIIKFPMGAQGESDILNEFQKMDGFDNKQLINAMGSAENNIFILLDKSKA